MARKRTEIVDMERTGLNIRNLLRKRGLSVKDVMKELNFESHQSIYSWFQGETIPSVDNMLRLSLLLDVPIDSLIISKDETNRMEERRSFNRKYIKKEDFDALQSISQEHGVPFSKIQSVYEMGYLHCREIEKASKKRSTER